MIDTDIRHAGRH